MSAAPSALSRTPTADSRYLLAASDYNDCSQQPRLSAQEEGFVVSNSIALVRCTLGGGGHPAPADFTVRIAVFDFKRQEFVARPTTLAKDAPMAFRTNADAEWLILELLDDKDDVHSWGKLPLGGVASSDDLLVDLRSGTADVLFLDPLFAPAPSPDPLARVTLNFSPLLPEYGKKLEAIAPRGHFIPLKHLEGVVKSGVSYRLKLPQVKISVPMVLFQTLMGGTKADPMTTEFVLSVTLHNTLKVQAPIMDIPMIRNGGTAAATAGNLLGSKPNSFELISAIPADTQSATEFASILSQPNVYVLFSLRTKTLMASPVTGSMPIDSIGFALAAFRLSDEGLLCDENVSVEALPMSLRRTTLSNDPRLSVSGLAANIKDAVPTLWATLEYYDTPRPAPKVAVEVATRGVKAAKVTSAAAAAAGTGATAVGTQGASQVPEVSLPNSAAADGAPGRRAGGEAAAAGVHPAVGSLSSATGGNADASLSAAALAQYHSDLHRMLTDIMGEVRELKQRVERLPAATSANPQPAEATPRGQAQARAAQQREGAPASVQILEFAPTRVTISHGAREKLLQGVFTPLKHQATGAVLDQAAPELMTRAWPTSLFAIRFDGVSTPKAGGGGSSTNGVAAVPKLVEVAFAFGLHTAEATGASSEAIVGPAQTSLVFEDNVLSTFALTGPSGQRGCVWHESVPPATNAAILHLLSAFKTEKGRSIRIELRDGLTKFVLGSGTIPLEAFRRGAHSPYALHGFDIPIEVTENRADRNVVMTLHTTLAAIGWDLPPAAAASASAPSGNGPAPRSMHSDVINVPRLTGVHEAPSSSTTAPDTAKLPPSGPGSSATTAKDVVPTPSGLENLPPDSRLKHLQRLDFVKRKLLNVGATPTAAAGGASLPSSNAGLKLDLNDELKLSLSERKREEIKLARIQAKLMERVTVHKEVAVAVGRTSLIEVPFANPFPVSATFRIETIKAASSSSTTSVIEPSRAFGRTVKLSAKEQISIPLVVRVAPSLPPSSSVTAPNFSIGAAAAAAASAPSAASQHKEKVTVHVLVDSTGEIVRAVHVDVLRLPPLVDRVIETCWPPVNRAAGAASSAPSSSSALGQPQQALIEEHFLRRFDADDFIERGPNGAQELALLSKYVGNLCLFPFLDDPSVATVSTAAKVEQAFNGVACAWEVCQIAASPLPPASPHGVSTLIHFYRDAGKEKHVTTWLLKVAPLIQLEANDIKMGQTNDIALPVVCDSCFASASNVAISVVSREGSSSGTSTVGTVVAKVRPYALGEQSFLIHAFQGSNMHRYAVRLRAVLPVPTLTKPLPITIAQTTLPQLTRFTFVNSSDDVRFFKLECNYKEYVSPVPLQFSCGPQDPYVISLRIAGLPPRPQRYPVWLFINDAATDKTVTSCFIDLTVNP